MSEYDEEFAAAVRRAGVAIPPERWEVMRDAYASMQKLLSVLAVPLAYQDEPAVLPIWRREAGNDRKPAADDRRGEPSDCGRRAVAGCADRGRAVARRGAEPSPGRLYRDHCRQGARRREAGRGRDSGGPLAGAAARHPVRADGHLRRGRAAHDSAFAPAARQYRSPRKTRRRRRGSKPPAWC